MYTSSELSCRCPPARPRANKPASFRMLPPRYPQEVVIVCIYIVVVKTLEGRRGARPPMWQRLRLCHAVRPRHGCDQCPLKWEIRGGGGARQGHSRRNDSASLAGQPQVGVRVVLYDCEAVVCLSVCSVAQRRQGATQRSPNQLTNVIVIGGGNVSWVEWARMKHKMGPQTFTSQPGSFTWRLPV